MLRTAAAAAARRRVSVAPARFAHELAQAQAQPAIPARDGLEPSWVPLYRRISILCGRPPGTVAAEMDSYLRQRRPLSADQIVAYVRRLRKFRSNAWALELMDWMESRGAKLSLGNQALRLGLVSRVHGIQAAEEYFWSLPDKSKKTYSCLLNCYGEHGMACKGLELYEKMKVMGVVPNTLLYNNLMTLYQKAGQPEKIPSTFEEMRESGISANNFTYFTLIESYITMNDLEAAEKGLEELQKVAPLNWSLYTLMANSYVKLELCGKAEIALKKAEEVMNKAELSSWYFLLSIYARCGNATEVKRIWESLKSTFKKCLNKSYLVMLEALSTIDDFESLQQIFQEWESSHEHYDMRITNVMIKAYLDKGMIDEAEAIRQRTMSQGHCNVRTVYIFAEFYLDKSDVTAALEILRDSKNMVTADKWVRSEKLMSRFLKHYEESKDVDGVESFCDCLKKLECLDAEAYEGMVRTYIAAGRTNPSIAQRIEDDGIHIGPETTKLLESVSGN
ncbi:pentatricopeptide repeat-containing protein At4g01990, mitochondrial-like [Hordeum vulgare subsp. vulgare]|uniref:Pentacotripeptide-repeat region of PRORP domain-containing protein n=1 Tax=Hordeum vulgare subsp. vulgare TaxID=112509 RepID=A0A8I6YRD4_HORVV|nr:pentatricopeptide repeat-containing protein At4g01990, mitochondrial-like [Hordeum vulgare subsp. vulgare]